jgi:integrase
MKSKRYVPRSMMEDGRRPTVRSTAALQRPAYAVENSMRFVGETSTLGRVSSASAGRIELENSVCPRASVGYEAFPLAAFTVGVLASHHEQSAFRGKDDLVFCHPIVGRVMDTSLANRRFLAAADSAGLADLRFHDLRHTYGTQLAAVGAPLRAIQEWMGHSNPNTTSVYLAYAPDPGAAVAIADRAFGALEGSHAR